MSERTTGKFTRRLRLPSELDSILQSAPSCVLAESRQQLTELALGGDGAARFEVAYEVPGRGRIVEADVVHCRNGLAVNYTEPYMRRRDPDCMVVADDLPTDKTRFTERFSQPFAALRREILDWLASQDLVILAFQSGGMELGAASLLVAPANAAFFVAALANLQTMIPADQLPENYAPLRVYLLGSPVPSHALRWTAGGGAPPQFRSARNIRPESLSRSHARRGIYGVLINIGEQEGWTTLHGSTVEVVTPYDNIVTIMHEGASGGGKSEMLEYPHREIDGRLLLGLNTVTKERRYLSLTQGCTLHPVTDDMALSHPRLKGHSGRICVTDAEDAWFVRVDHITEYGAAPDLEAYLYPAAGAVGTVELRGGAGCHVLDLGAHGGRTRPTVPESPRELFGESSPTWSIDRWKWTCEASVCARLPVHATSRLTASWASSTACRRPWPGSGGWFLRGATRTRASRTVRE